MKQKAMLAIVTALASLAIALTIQQQDVAAFNENNQFVGNTHSHTAIDSDGVTGNDGSVINNGQEHTNTNFNSHREDTSKTNSHDKPNNDK